MGNYNAYMVAYPDIDWVKFTKEFILKLEIKEKQNYKDDSNSFIWSLNFAASSLL